MTAQHKMNRNDCLNSDERVCVHALVCAYANGAHLKHYAMD